MIAERPYVIYTLPISRTTQALIGGKVETRWENIKSFLLNCTTADIEEPHSIYLTGYSADEDNGESVEVADKLLTLVSDSFGLGAVSPIGYHYPSGLPHKQTKTNWDLSGKDLTKALKFMIDGQPWPKQNLGPIELIISYNFNLIDPITKKELPNQQFTSGFLIWLSRNKWISPSLCFPFEEPDETFWNYLNKIEKYLPFKLDRKYLRLGKSNKKGTANMFSKL